MYLWPFKIQFDASLNTDIRKKRGAIREALKKVQCMQALLAHVKHGWGSNYATRIINGKCTGTKALPKSEERLTDIFNFLSSSFPGTL